MRALLISALMVCALPAAGAMQEARPVDPLVAQRFIDADTAARQQMMAAAPDTVLSREFRMFVAERGNAESKAGRTKEAIRAFEAAIELGQQTGVPRTWIGAKISLGMVYGLVGDYDASVRLLNEALAATSPDTDDDLIAAAANNLGNVYRRRGQLDLALETYERALRSNEAAKREPQVARSLNNIGIIYQQQGDFRQAIDYYLRSLAVKERVGPPEEVVSTLGNIGDVYALQGNSAQAVEYLERSLTIAERSKNARMIIGSLSDLGRVMIEAKQLTAAEARLTRARDLAEQAGYAEHLASALTSLANIAIERRQFDRARDDLSRVQAIYKETADPIGTGQVLISLTRIAIESGRAEDGVGLARQAVETLSSLGTPTALMDAQVLYGEALTGVRRWDDAIAAYQRAIELIERGVSLVAGDAEDRLQFRAVTTTAFAGLVHAYAATGRAGDALAAAERGRARTLLDMLGSGRGAEDELTAAERARQVELDTALTALNERIAAQRSRAGKGQQPDPALATEVETIRRTRHDFYLGLDARHPRLRFARGDAPVSSARDIAAALPPRSALVEFVVSTRGAWILMLKPRAGGDPRLIVKAAGLPSARLLSLAGEFTTQVATRDLAFSANAHALYNALFGPIDGELAGIDQLVVVPHGGLWQLPFQALRTPRQKYVIEERAISYAPSASTLTELQSRQRPRAAQPKVVAFGDPRVTDPRAALLPHAAREARAVAAVYSNNSSGIATDTDATESRFRQLAPRADIVHIATHGVVDNSSPLFSYLMLAGSGAASSVDGRLEGRELINMQLGAELVVLSACDTALGRVASGEGVVGLSWALFAAGASTTTVSLWPVDSASTTNLMSTFHKDRRRLTGTASAAPTANALRAAQIDLLARVDSRHPFYWAGFVVIGVP